ncbi:hypothetical protein [Kineococcus sp. SYSU DK002]|uniref:hypothetical protein n=1 Tax=Kineococcus sp. SYSU DK002 TaxID=3383123 RepID=UPI003D7CDC4E
MQFALTRSCDPRNTGPTDGEVDRWLELDDALRLAAKIPTATHGTVQVRRVVQFEG